VKLVKFNGAMFMHTTQVCTKMNKNTQLQIAKQTQRGLDITAQTHFAKEAHEIYMYGIQMRKQIMM